VAGRSRRLRGGLVAGCGCSRCRLWGLLRGLTAGCGRLALAVVCCGGRVGCSVFPGWGGVVRPYSRCARRHGPVAGPVVGVGSVAPFLRPNEGVFGCSGGCRLTGLCGRPWLGAGACGGLLLARWAAVFGRARLSLMPSVRVLAWASVEFNLGCGPAGSGSFCFLGW